MSAAQQPTSFGKIYPPDETGLAKQSPEPILDPDLPIIDPHHHLWDRLNHRYLLEDFLADVRSGHHIIATVFEECHSIYHADGPEELRPVGETEFVAGIAARSASGLYGPTRVAAGTSVLSRVGGLLAPLHGDLHRTVRARPLYVREQFSRGKDGHYLGGAVEHL